MDNGDFDKIIVEQGIKAIEVWEACTGKCLGWYPVVVCMNKRGGFDTVGPALGQYKYLDRLTAKQCFDSAEAALAAAHKFIETTGAPELYRAPDP